MNSPPRSEGGYNRRTPARRFDYGYAKRARPLQNDGREAVTL